MMFGGVKETYPRLGLVLYIVGLGGSQASETFGRLVKSVCPPGGLVMIVPTL